MTKSAPSISDLQPNQLVEAFGVSRSHASELIKGLKVPSLDLAAKIETLFGIPATAWIANRDALRDRAAEDRPAA